MISDAEHLHCMEVWGGNRAVATAVAMPGLDAWIFSRPAGGVERGGDVHYASSCAAGALTRMLVADVCGHGEDAAASARRLRTLMRRHINHHDQLRFVRSMNGEFSALAKNGRFATAVAFTYDAPINRLQVCNAGHPPPLFYKMSTRQWSYMQPRGKNATNFPLGIDDAGEYIQFEVPIEVGDIVLCYTDALPECRTTESDMLGSEGLLQMLRKIDATDISQLISNLVREVEQAGTVNDDLTVLLFRPNGLRKHVPFFDRLAAPFKLLREIVGSYISPE